MLNSCFAKEPDSQREALMNRLSVIMEPVGQKLFKTKVCAPCDTAQNQV